MSRTISAFGTDILTLAEISEMGSAHDEEKWYAFLETIKTMNDSHKSDKLIVSNELRDLESRLSDLKSKKKNNEDEVERLTRQIAISKNELEYHEGRTKHYQTNLKTILAHAWPPDPEDYKFFLLHTIEVERKAFLNVYQQTPLDLTKLCKIVDNLNSNYKKLSHYIILQSLSVNNIFQQIKDNEMLTLIRLLEKTILSATLNRPEGRALREPNSVCSLTANINATGITGQNPAVTAIEEGDFEQFELLVNNGANIHARYNEPFNEGSGPTLLELAVKKNLVEHTLLLLKVSAYGLIKSDIHFDFSAEPEGSRENYEFKYACSLNNITYLRNVLDQCYKNNYVLEPSTIIIGLALAIQKGFEEIADECLQLAALNDHIKKALVDICLEHGYPKILRLFQIHKFPFTEDQKKLTTVLLKTESIPAKGAAYVDRSDSTHYGHGGAATEGLYQKEFKDMVAYVKYYITNNVGTFMQLIENLGTRRMRQATLTNLAPQDLYGNPHAVTQTEYNAVAPEYKNRIHERYTKLPVVVLLKLNDRFVNLTMIDRGGWSHPTASPHRAEILAHVDKLCQKIKGTQYNDPLVFAKDLAEVYWVLSHCPSIARGIRTVIESLSDGFWETKFPHLPRSKTTDLNCEALIYDKCEDYVERFVEICKASISAAPLANDIKRETPLSNALSAIGGSITSAKFHKTKDAAAAEAAAPTNASLKPIQKK